MSRTGASQGRQRTKRGGHNWTEDNTQESDGAQDKVISILREANSK